MALPANSEEIFILLLINLLTSLCRRLPKSLNIVEPPDKTELIIQENSGCLIWVRTNVSIERTPGINWTICDDVINNFAY